MNNNSSLITNNNSNIRAGVSSNPIYKDKILNLYSLLQNFKTKSLKEDLVKYLIREMDYVPIKIEGDSSVDVKFVKDIDWKINLK